MNDKIQSKQAVISPDLTINYEDHGNGLPLIFIPGWIMTSRVFSKNIGELSNHYRTIAYDPRSHGCSTPTATGNNYYQHGRDLSDLLNFMKLEDVVLIGWSLGAITAYSYIEQFGTNKVRAMISIDICPRPVRAGETGWGIGPLEQVRKIQADITSPDQSAFIQHYAGHAYLKGTASEKFISFIHSEAMQTPAHLAALLLADGNLCDYSEVAKQASAKIPILHVVSETAMSEAIAWISKNMPNSSIRALGAHMMFWEFPDEFNRLVDSFISGTDNNN